MTTKSSRCEHVCRFEKPGPWAANGALRTLCPRWLTARGTATKRGSYSPAARGISCRELRRILRTRRNNRLDTLAIFFVLC